MCSIYNIFYQSFAASIINFPSAVNFFPIILFISAVLNLNYFPYTVVG